jgi:hypothetical protein
MRFGMIEGVLGWGSEDRESFRFLRVAGREPGGRPEGLPHIGVFVPN